MNASEFSKTRQKSLKLRRSLRYSFWDGFFASIQFGIIDQFATPLALFLGANNIGIGFLNFVRNGLVSIVQIVSADITGTLKSRKRLITFSVFAAAFLWLPTFFVPFLFPEQKVFVFIVLFAVASSFNMLATPAWASLMSKYVPASKRGKYFGFRNTVLGIVYGISVIIAGIILHSLHLINLFLGFAILIFIASASRFISWFFLLKLYEPKWQVGTTHYFSFWDFIKRFFRSNFAQFSVFTASLLLGVAIASPFFAVYILKELKFDYLHYTFLMWAAVFTTFLAQQYWGGFADRFGNMRIIKLTSVLVSIIPFMWLFSKSFIFLFVIQLLSGFFWAGFNLTSANFIYDAATSMKRERCVAYFNFLSGLGLGFGALFGGLIFRFLPPVFGSKFFLLFIFSGIVRIFGSVCVNFFVREVKKVHPVEIHTLLLDLSGIRFIGILSDIMLKRSKKSSIT